MAKTNLTYLISLEGGVEEGPLTLSQLQPLLRDRKVQGSTFVKRSDRAEWTTAADLPELKVRDVVVSREPVLSTAGEEMEKELHFRKVRSGVSWLFWIGALSFLNGALAFFGIGKAYAMGLGSAQLVVAIGENIGSNAIWISLGANLVLAFGFIIAGVLSWHEKPKLLGPAIAVYVADAILCLLFDQWLSVGLHALALFFMIPSYVASLEARGIALTWRVATPHAATALVLSAAGLVAFKALEKTLIPEPAAWAAQAPASWPQLSLANSAEFKGHTALDAGNSFFIRTRRGSVVAATALHLLGDAGGVKPAVKMSELDSVLKDWNLFSRSATPESARIGGLHGTPAHYGALNDWILLRLAHKDVARLPAEPLQPRFTIVEKGETVCLIGAGASGTAQETHRATVTDANDWSIDAKLEKPIDLTGFSGSPIVDSNGALVGILTSSRAKADKQGKFASFIAESVLEVKPLLR